MRLQERYLVQANLGAYATISIPKEISVGTFRYDFLAGNPISLKKGAKAPFLRKKGAPAPFLVQAAPFLRKKEFPPN
jgi:hypothetical protein